MTEFENNSSPQTSAAMPREASPRRRKTMVGIVRSDRMQKTITVEILRLEKHPRYHKYVRRRTTCKAHDEKEEAGAGDLVRIAETRPLSKHKRWRLVEIIRRAKSWDVPAANGAPEAAEEGGGTS